jgi:protein-S-isoprenylcysteine O-methyltransferase Ste14
LAYEVTLGRADGERGSQRSIRAIQGCISGLADRGSRWKAATRRGIEDVADGLADLSHRHGTSSRLRTCEGMTIARWMIPALWLVFLAYWAISAIGAKRNVAATPWWKLSVLRLPIVALVVVLLTVPEVRRTLRLVQAHMANTALAGAIGTLLVGLGVGLAIFARAYLGRNWGTPMSRKENPELVTGGPYAFVRHPIYSGIILAMFGTMIGLSVVWALPLVLFAPYFIYSARREEEFMCQQFGETYRAYMRRTKMLVPFVL